MFEQFLIVKIDDISLFIATCFKYTPISHGMTSDEVENVHYGDEFQFHGAKHFQNNSSTFQVMIKYQEEVQFFVPIIHEQSTAV